MPTKQPVSLLEWAVVAATLLILAATARPAPAF
jgi:hypothetical protein